MGSHVVSFRFSDQEIELLRQQAEYGNESTNAIAQRLLRGLLGPSTDTSTTVNAVESRVIAMVDARIQALTSEFVDKRIQGCLQRELAPVLGELSA